MYSIALFVVVSHQTVILLKMGLSETRFPGSECIEIMKSNPRYTLNSNPLDKNNSYHNYKILEQTKVGFFVMVASVNPSKLTQKGNWVQIWQIFPDHYSPHNGIVYFWSHCKWKHNSDCCVIFIFFLSGWQKKYMCQYKTIVFAISVILL